MPGEMPILRKPPKKLFGKVILSKGYGFHTPQDGSVCKMKIISDEANLLSSENSEREIIVGDVDDPLECMIEHCIRTMKEEEVCQISFEHHSFNSDCLTNEDSLEENASHSVKDSCKCESQDCKIEEPLSEKMDKSDCSEPDQLGVVGSESVLVDTDVNEAKESASVCTNSVNEVMMQFKLLAYTREPEIWEMSVTEKWRRASYHKQRGLELYDSGTYQYAFRRFGLTLKYVISLEHDVPSGQEEGMDIKGLKLSCYLNVAACQMRHHNFESVVVNSSRALALQPNNAKALYRRGAAYLQLQEYEKAKADLTSAQMLEPKNQAILKQLQLLKSNVQELNKYYASAMKTLFS